MGGKARPYRRTRIRFRPVDDPGEVLPERLLGKGCGVRLGAGYDQPVDLQVIEIGDVGVLSVDPRLRRLRSLDGRQREAVQKDAIVARGRFQKTDELALRCLQRRVRHVVDEADGKDRIGRVLTRDRIHRRRAAARAPERG